MCLLDGDELRNSSCVIPFHLTQHLHAVRSRLRVNDRVTVAAKQIQIAVRDALHVLQRRRGARSVTTGTDDVRDVPDNRRHRHAQLLVPPTADCTLKRVKVAR